MNKQRDLIQLFELIIDKIKKDYYRGICAINRILEVEGTITYDEHALIYWYLKDHLPKKRYKKSYYVWHPDKKIPRIWWIRRQIFKLKIKRVIQKIIS